MYLFNIRGHLIEIPDRIFNYIKGRYEKTISIDEYETAVKPFLKPLHDKYGYPYSSLYVWLLLAYESEDYYIKAYKVLAVKTFKYTDDRERHLEGRMIISVDVEYYNNDFFEFCKNCIELFFEYVGYTDFIQHAKQKACIERIEEVTLNPDENVEFFIEIFDYDYERYPYEANGELSPEYWKNYSSAIAEFYDEITETSMHYWRTSSKIENLVNEKCGSEVDRFED